MLERVYKTSSVPYTSLAKFAYDSVITLATLLNRTLTIIENGNIQDTGCQNRNGNGVRLEDFSYHNDLMGCLFFSVRRNLSLDGILVIAPLLDCSIVILVDPIFSYIPLIVVDPHSESPKRDHVVI